MHVTKASPETLCSLCPPYNLDARVVITFRRSDRPTVVALPLCLMHALEISHELTATVLEVIQDWHNLVEGP